MFNIIPARFPEDQTHVLTIFREYIASTTVSLDFQEYETEFANLPGKYASPWGMILLAWSGSEVVGCAAFRQVDPQTCEMKRVYVSPTTRGHNLGRKVVERIINEARNAGYTRMCLDVLPEFKAAQRLYETLGFRDGSPVTYNPVPGTRFMQLDLI